MPNTQTLENKGKCPFRGSRIGGAEGTVPQIDDWWPNRLKVELLHSESERANPLKDFDYKKAFESLNLEEVKSDIKALLTESKEWWPADYGNYGPQMIRMAWHSAGTYRIADGRGGADGAMIRFAPLNSWWDNGNIDKSRRLIWPVKQKYGPALSWGDLIVLTGNCALELMGFPTFGYGGGRRDNWEADRATYWGPEFWDGKKLDQASIDSSRHGHPDEMVNANLRWKGKPGLETSDLENPLAATHSNLIYVNPEGPAASGDPLESAQEIRESFARMAMNDEETVALVAGGHAFGKSHGKVQAKKIGPAPEAAPIRAMGMGWQNPEGNGFAEYTMTNGIEGSWTPNPTKWDNDYLTNLFKFDWEKTESPAGAIQWKPKNADAPKTPDAHVDGQMNELMMMTSDLALKRDPIYREICEKFLADFDYFTDAFSRAWYKLTHRDMGPKVRLLGPEVPEEELLWQDPVPECNHDLVNDNDIKQLKAAILESGLSASELVSAAWSSASNYRDSDKRGGANGARVRLNPMKNWSTNRPEELDKVLKSLQKIQDNFNGSGESNKKISLADLIVLAGNVGVEKAAREAGVQVDVPFTPGRMDASQEQTDGRSFDWLKPVSDGFRNYHNEEIEYHVEPEKLFLDRAHLLTLSAPEWTVLVGGLRVLDQNWDHSKHGVFTDHPGRLSNDFFKVVTSMDYEWTPADDKELIFNLNLRKGGQTKYTATRCDLIFGSNSQLRSVAEVYAAEGSQERFVRDFVTAWNKVMMLDRFEAAEEREKALA